MPLKNKDTKQNIVNTILYYAPVQQKIYIRPIRLIFQTPELATLHPLPNRLDILIKSYTLSIEFHTDRKNITFIIKC